MGASCDRTPLLLPSGRPSRPSTARARPASLGSSLGPVFHFHHPGCTHSDLYKMWISSRLGSSLNPPPDPTARSAQFKSASTQCIRLSCPCPRVHPPPDGGGPAPRMPQFLCTPEAHLRKGHGAAVSPDRPRPPFSPGWKHRVSAPRRGHPRLQRGRPHLPPRAFAPRRFGVPDAARRRVPAGADGTRSNSCPRSRSLRHPPSSANFLLVATSGA